jgi:hypothetical protein
MRTSWTRSESADKGIRDELPRKCFYFYFYSAPYCEKDKTVQPLYLFLLKNLIIMLYMSMSWFVFLLLDYRRGSLIYLSLPYLGGVISAPDKYRRRSNTDNKEAKPFFRFAGKRTAKGFCGICVPFFAAFVFYYVCACMSILFTSTYTSLFFFKPFFRIPLGLFRALISVKGSL